MKDASSNRRAAQRRGFLDRVCCSERRLGDGRSVVVDWWPAARRIRLACRCISWPLTTTCSFTIENRE